MVYVNLSNSCWDLILISMDRDIIYPIFLDEPQCQKVIIYGLMFMVYDFYELYNILNFITMETSIILCAIALLVYYSTIFFLIRWLIDSKKRDPKKVFVFKLLSVLLAFIAGWAVVFFA